MLVVRFLTQASRGAWGQNETPSNKGLEKLYLWRIRATEDKELV